MTVKEKLIREIEQAPESFIAQLLSFLHLLQSHPHSPSLEIVTDESLFKYIDGFIVIKEQNSLPNIDWVSLAREERINDLM
ncbi:MAG: hypothetical protein LH649_17090 [Pseudanabaena sp. CAN_BIN31]|nr:hypothetical protein [Pseudanabaena sp. CAN_BIN31]